MDSWSRAPFVCVCVCVCVRRHVAYYSFRKAWGSGTSLSAPGGPTSGLTGPSGRVPAACTSTHAIQYHICWGKFIRCLRSEAASMCCSLRSPLRRQQGLRSEFSIQCQASRGVLIQAGSAPSVVTQQRPAAQSLVRRGVCIPRPLSDTRMPPRLAYAVAAALPVVAHNSAQP